MRRLMLAEHGGKGMWDLKQARGGLVEVEFIAQSLQIAARRRRCPRSSTATRLPRWRGCAIAACSTATTTTSLREAALLYHRPDAGAAA